MEQTDQRRWGRGGEDARQRPNLAVAHLRRLARGEPSPGRRGRGIRKQVPDASISVELLGSAELLARYNERPSYTFPMRYQEVATSDNSHIALVTLRDYYNLIVGENGRLRRHLFEYNVRDYEGNVSVNQEIRRSLGDPESPQFWWLNNGVTILCSAGKTYSLSDIQIVNGLQTSHEIYEALRRGATPETDGRMLLVRIIVTDDPAVRDQVIRATNRQTSVKDSSLRAIHCPTANAVGSRVAAELSRGRTALRARLSRWSRRRG